MSEEKTKERNDVPEVPPIVVDNVEYSTGFSEGSGFIQAKDLQTNTVLWMTNIYAVQYDEEKETDVQDVYISSLKLEDKILLIENEKGRKFSLNIETKEVSAI